MYPAAGYRDYSSGSVESVGANGVYWNASPYSRGSNYASYMDFGSVYVHVNTSYFRAYGFSVRCVKE